MESFVTRVCFIAVVVGISVQGNDEVSMPLLDNNLQAALTANIDVSGLNTHLKNFIEKEVERRVNAALKETVNKISDEMSGIKKDIDASNKDHANILYNNVTKTMDGTVNKLRSDIEKDYFNVLYSNVSKLVNENVNKLKSEIEKGNKKYGFLAGRKAHLYNQPDGTIVKFDNVIVNVGQCYDPSTGKFTAPINGLYQFSWTTVSDERTDFTSVIVRNGDEIVENAVDSDSVSDAMTGSQTVVLDLVTGDKVWLGVHGGDGKNLLATWGSKPCSTFSGFKI